MMAQLVTESIDVTVARLDERVQNLAGAVDANTRMLERFQHWAMGALVAALIALAAPYVSAFRLTPTAAAAAPGPEKRIGDYVEMRPGKEVRK